MLGYTCGYYTFIDNCTRYCYLYLLKNKDEAFKAFKAYKTEVENQLNTKIKMIWSDWGGDYVVPMKNFVSLMA